MPTCPDTCPVVRAQILMEQEALKAAAREQIKDPSIKRAPPINESRSEGRSIKIDAESIKSKQSAQRQQMNSNITQPNLQTPGRSPDKRYQQDESSAASRGRYHEDDQLDQSSYRSFQGRSGAASDAASRVTYHEDEQMDEAFHDNNSARSRTTAGTASRAAYREDEQLDEIPYKDVSERSRATAGAASRGRRREDEHSDKSYRDFQERAAPSAASRVRQRENVYDEMEEAGPSSISHRHSPCGPECPLKRYKELLKRRAEEKQRKLDRYLITKGFHYFDNLCTCSVMCLFNQLSRDHFVTSLIHSALLFAVGLKLCSELYAWQIPSNAMFY